MHKVMTLVHRPAGETRATFLAAFPSAVAEAFGAAGAGVDRCILDLVDVPAEDAGLRPGGEPVYDAVIELCATEAGPQDLASAAAGLLGSPRVAPLVGETAAYVVKEHLERDYDRDWPAGTRSPGVKSIYIAIRHGSLSPAGFAEHWGTTHAPLALKHHVGMWRYARNVVVRPLLETAPAYDGFAELHFRSAQDLREKMYDSDEGRAVIAADVARFSSGGRVLHTTEHILRG
jgi:uncharacterized protein (TIGR02118 family)